MWNKRTESFRDEPTRSAGSGGARSPGAEINHPSLPKTLSPAAKPSPGIFFILISLQLHGMVLNIVASINFLFTNVFWIFDIYLLQVTAVVKYWLGGPDPLDYISMFANPGLTLSPPGPRIMPTSTITITQALLTLPHTGTMSPAAWPTCMEMLGFIRLPPVQRLPRVMALSLHSGYISIWFFFFSHSYTF